MSEPLEALMLTALFAQLQTPDLTSPATPIARPLFPYTPTPSVAYLDVKTLLRADPEHFGLTFGNSDIFNGVFQVDAVVPNGAGELPGTRLAALVAVRFALGTSLVVGTRLLKVNKTPKIATAVSDAPWIRFPVSVPYQLIT